MDVKQKLKLKKLIKKLESIRGRHTELVSVYIPAGYDIIKIIQHLQQEQGTAANIKDAKTRKNVIDSLERMIRHLRVYKKTPANGLAVFAGNASASPSKITIEVWSIEPPEPLNFRMYRCDQTFMVEPLKDMMEHRETYGLIVLDRREASIGILKGNTIKEVTSETSNVPGKTRAGGQCQHPDTVIQLMDGNLIKIKETHNPHVVKSVDFNNLAIKNSPITDKWKAKKDEVYHIITHSPQLKVKSSKDHVFFVSTEEGIKEKAAEGLKKGDILLMPEKIEVKGKIQKLEPNEFYNSFIINKKGRELIQRQRLNKKIFQRKLAKRLGVTQTAISVIELGKRNINRSFLRRLCSELDINFKEFLNHYTTPYKRYNINLPKTLDSDFAQFIGYLIGDGCIEKDRITFFEQGKGLAFQYKEKFDKYFNINSSYRYREKKNYHQIRFTSRPLVRLIKKRFPKIKKALNSEVPKSILKSNDKVVASFLKGLFDAEGGVNTSRMSVSIACNNQYLIQQVQLLLLRFSILTSFIEYDNKRNPYSNNPVFKLYINEKQSLELFQEHIGFTDITKRDKLQKIIQIKSDKSNSRQILASGKKVRKIIEKAGYNKQMFSKVSNFFYDKRMMSKQTFKNSILKQVKDKKLYKELEKIYNTPILPVKIFKIHKTKEKINMIDISVKNQNFIANGIIVHNSAQRYARIRLEMKKEFFKRVAEVANKTFLGMKELKGILVGGPMPTKEEFVDGDFLNNELKKKIIALQDLGDTGESGLHELVDKSKDALEKEAVMKEKTMVKEFFELLRKNPGKTAYGKAEVMKAVEMGAVEKFLISEDLPDDEIEEAQEKSEKFGAEIFIISTETREGVQIRDLGGYAAILRYALK